MRTHDPQTLNLSALRRRGGADPTLSWNIDDSIWVARKLTGNSGDYFETSECMRAMYDLDWGAAEKGGSVPSMASATAATVSR